MKHIAPWLVSLVFALAVVGVFPRMAIAAAEITPCDPQSVVLGFAIPIHQDGPSEFQSSPEDDQPLIDFAELDVSGGAESDGDDPVEDGFAFLPHTTSVMLSACAGDFQALAPPLRASQSFVGLHDKVPR